LKATKIGELRRLSAEEKDKVVEIFLNLDTHLVDRGFMNLSRKRVPRWELTEEEVDTRRTEIKEMITCPVDYKITWTVKVSQLKQWTESHQGYGFRGDVLGGAFTYELEKATQQQPTLITIFEEPFWLYQNLFYRAPLDLDSEEILLLIKEQELKKTKKLEKLRKLTEVSDQLDKASSRERIPEEVQMFVWRRDEGKCVKCGSQENLEYDHVIPVSRGGANTARNIQLLCEPCNRGKSDKI